MQALRRSGCWGDNSFLNVLLDNNKNYAFTGIKRNFFWRFAPWNQKLEEGRKEKQPRLKHFFKINKIEMESLYIIQRWANFPKFWYSFRSSVKVFKPYHCHKLILNNINKMSLFQRFIQNSAKHLSFLKTRRWKLLSIFAKTSIWDVWQEKLIIKFFHGGHMPEVYSEPWKISKMALFSKVNND